MQTDTVDILTVRTPTKELRPLGDAVVFRAEKAERLISGLYAPEKAEKLRRAVVVAVGPGKVQADGTRRPPAVRPGDHIVLWADAPNPSTTLFTGEELWMCHEDDIAVVVEPVRSPDDAGSPS